MEDWHAWTIAGILLLILEMLTATFFAASFGVAALLTAVAAANGMSVLWQLGIFALTSVLCIFVVRPLFRNIYRHSEDKPILVRGMIGLNGTVVDEIEARGGHGRVKVGSEEWRAISADGNGVAAGTRVEILRVEGATLTVTPV